MPKRITYQKGELLNGIKFIKDIESICERRMALFECPYCGKEFECRISDVKSGMTQSCRCYQARGWHKTHGLRGHPLYSKWASIKKRCYNKNEDNYIYYGGREISMCDEWINNFMAFYDYILTLPKIETNEKLTIDRIDNDGNYEPGNLRWATHKMQMANKRGWGSVTRKTIRQ